MWKEHFKSLLGNSLKITGKPIKTIIHSYLELLTKIKNRKAAGLNEIPPEVWKTRKFDDLLLQGCI